MGDGDRIVAGAKMSALDRITVDPAVCGGRPCIRGLRIRVKDVLDLLAAGATHDEILADYLADRVLAARPIALLPTLTYGFYPAFLEYPGSVSLSQETQARAVVEVARSMARYGPRRFYVLNTGVSTLRALRPAAERPRPKASY
jgi:uncharacterized protein (DUF433 family)